MNLNASSDWPECSLKASKNYRILSFVLAVLNISHATWACYCNSTEQIISNHLSRAIRRSTFSVFGLMHLIKWGLAAVILSIRIAKEVFHKGNNCMHNININIATKSKVALSHLLRDLRLLFGFTTDIHRQFMSCNNANPNHQINIWKQYCCPQKDNFTSLAARPRSKYLVKWTKHVSVNSRKKV